MVPEAGLHRKVATMPAPESQKEDEKVEDVEWRCGGQVGLG